MRDGFTPRTLASCVLRADDRRTLERPLMTKLDMLSIAVLTGASAAALPASAAQTSSVDGWYAPDQATRGKGSYNANCAVCHGSSLQGGAGPALSGASFAAKWRDRPLRDLYTVAHDQMPLTAPGKLSPTTSFDSADDDATNWLTYNKGYKGFRFSKLDQINVNNAPQLRAVCVMQLGEVGTFQTGPVIYDGTMSVTTSHGVYALDAASCERRWEYHYSPWAPEVQVNNKGVAIAEGRVIRGTTDGSLLALDAATGKVLWLRKIMDVTKGEFAVAAPLIRNGIVYIGKAGADWGIQGAMMAFRAADGTKVWGTLLLPRKGDPAYATWKNPASIATGGGSTWSSFSLDTE